MMKLFTYSDTWTGGAVELLVMLGEASPETVLSALEAGWTWPDLDGPYLTNTHEPEPHKRTRVRSYSLDDYPMLYGVAKLPNAQVVAFSGCIVHDEDGYWLYFGVPVGSLTRAFEIGSYPFSGNATDLWVSLIHRWLFTLAERIFRVVPFQRGVIGWLTTIEVEELACGDIPEQRYHTYLRQAGGALECLLPNVDEPLIM